ncbi:hypothetical protein HK405_008894, partial [Cladochytrium tenue]
MGEHTSDGHDPAANEIPESWARAALAGGGASGLVGLVFGSSVAWWVHQPLSMAVKYTFTKGARFAAFGAILSGTHAFTAQTRQKDDFYNAAIAGAVTGLALGIRGGTVPRIVFHTAALSGLAAATDVSYRQTIRAREPTLQKDARRDS